MKARLLIGVLTCAAMLAVLAGVTTPAKADLGNWPTSCGANPGKYAVPDILEHLSSPGAEFLMKTDYNCGTGGTWLTELQRSTSDHPQDWSDLVEIPFTTSASQANQDKIHTDHITGFTCNDVFFNYRMKTWENGSSHTLALVGGC